MATPLKLLEALEDARELIQKHEFGEASQIVEGIWAWAEKAWVTLNDFEAMLFLGNFATVLKGLGQTARQVKVLERLCTLAEQDLDAKGVMASDYDIQWTGMDFVELGLAYRRAGRIDAARKAFEQARYILEELGWLVEVEELLLGKATTIGPSPSVPKREYQPKPAVEDCCLPTHQESALAKRISGEDDEGRRVAADIAGQLARVLLMESVTDRRPVAPWDPMSQRTTDGEQIDLLAQVLQIHAGDCQALDADIPLLIGVPPEFVEHAKAHLKDLQYGGLRPDQVCVLEEPVIPLFDDQGTWVMASPYQIRCCLAGGGICLANAIKAGVLSKLWRDGIRWLLCGQLANPAANADSPILRYLPKCSGDGVAEVVSREVMPASIVLALEIDKKPVCIDERRLTKDQLAMLPSDGVVSTGTFWIRCDKLTEAFGVNREKLESSWNAADWEGTPAPALREHAILAGSDQMGLAITVPFWEAIQSLNLCFANVGQDRAKAIQLA